MKNKESNKDKTWIRAIELTLNTAKEIGFGPDGVNAIAMAKNLLIAAHLINDINIEVQNCTVHVSANLSPTTLDNNYDWQPIDSASKIKTINLYEPAAVNYGCGSWYAGFWDSERAQWVSECCRRVVYATHWAPGPDNEPNEG